MHGDALAVVGVALVAFVVAALAWAVIDGGDE